MRFTFVNLRSFMLFCTQIDMYIPQYGKRSGMRYVCWRKTWFIKGHTDGKEYFFCAKTCLDEFTAPEKELTKLKKHVIISIINAGWIQYFFESICIQEDDENARDQKDPFCWKHWCNYRIVYRCPTCAGSLSAALFGFSIGVLQLRC